MLFVSLAKAKAGTQEERTARRLNGNSLKEFDWLGSTGLWEASTR